MCDVIKISLCVYCDQVHAPPENFKSEASQSPWKAIKFAS
jgi:hypothetical protein